MTPILSCVSAGPLEHPLLEEFNLLKGQHPIRSWEYCKAFEAIEYWRQCKQNHGAIRALDVGGAGSNFSEALTALGVNSKIVDPAARNLFDLQMTAGEAAGFGYQGEIVTCISVIEHVEDLGEMTDALSYLTAPGGLLFLTFDYKEDAKEDTYHFYWMRKKIFNLALWQGLEKAFERRGFRRLGDVDRRSPPQSIVYDYNFASLALVREE